MYTDHEAQDVRERSLCREKVRPGTGREAGLGHAPVSRRPRMAESDRPWALFIFIPDKGINPHLFLISFIHFLTLPL
jgi:hypothetical protein